MIPWRHLSKSGSTAQTQCRASHLCASGRSFSTRLSRSPPRSSSLPTKLSSWRSTLPPLQSSVPLRVARFASTAADLPPSVDLDQAPLAPGIDSTSASLDDILTSDFPPITEHIGYLKELGLDFGWGPTAFIETLLEHVHVYTGTPWWASIMLTALVVRLSLFKGYVGAADTTARLSVIGPTAQPISAQIKLAQARRDQQAVVRHTQELRAMYKAADVKLWRIAIPFVQIPLGYGTFRLMRAMAALPVPGLDEGGIFWLQDLTESDPYLILPIATSAAFYWMFKKGGELGSSNATMKSPAVRNLLQYGLPALSGTFMLFWPGAMQLTFFTTSMLSLGQTYLIRQPWVRERLRIHPLPDPSKNPSASYTGTMNVYQPPTHSTSAKKGTADGAFSGIRRAASEVIEKGQKMMDAKQASVVASSRPKRTAAELRLAQEYEDRRRREIAEERAERRKPRESIRRK